MVALCANGNHHNSARETLHVTEGGVFSKVLRLAIAQNAGMEILGRMHASKQA